MNYIMFHKFTVDNTRKVYDILDKKDIPTKKDVCWNTSVLSNNTMPDIPWRDYLQNSMFDKDLLCCNESYAELSIQKEYFKTLTRSNNNDN